MKQATDGYMRDRVLADLSQHRMRIVMDKDVHRHIRFSNDGSFIHHFNLTTWPGFLAITGDMGDYLFQRLPDMFAFHRKPMDHNIDIDYWAKKCRAQDVNSPIKHFSDTAFKRAVRDYASEFDEQEDKAGTFIADQIEDLLSATYSTADEAISQALYIVDDRARSVFPEIHEYDLTEHSYHFRWCCEAIRWGINQYDNQKGIANG